MSYNVTSPNSSPVARSEAFVGRVTDLLGVIRQLAHQLIRSSALIDRSFVLEDCARYMMSPRLEIVHDGAPVAMVQPLSGTRRRAQGLLERNERPWKEADRRLTRPRPIMENVRHARRPFTVVFRVRRSRCTGSRASRRVKFADGRVTRVILIAVSDS